MSMVTGSPTSPSGAARKPGAVTDAGAVNLLFGSPAGLTGAGSQVFTQDSPGVPGTAEHDDLFGGALAADN